MLSKLSLVHTDSFSVRFVTSFCDDVYFSLVIIKSSAKSIRNIGDLGFIVRFFYFARETLPPAFTCSFSRLLD